jgi:hypothetical protein
VLQLLEALKAVADLTKQEGMTLEDLRAITLEIRYNLRKGPVDSEPSEEEFNDDLRQIAESTGDPKAVEFAERLIKSSKLNSESVRDLCDPAYTPREKK